MKVLPIVNEVTAPYWEAAREHRLALQRCACGRLSHPPVVRCPSCGSATFTWPDMSGRGAVYAFTVVHHSVHPASSGSTPYVLALVELEEGPRILTNLRGCGPDEVRIGMPVEVCFEDVDESTTLPQFAPRGGGAA